MAFRTEPIHEKGERNVFCPNYGDCLDHASKHYWEYWACTRCAFQQVHQAPQVMQSLVSMRNDGTGHTVSSVMAGCAVNTWLNA